MCIDAFDNVFVVDGRVIRKIDTNNFVTTIAGLFKILTLKGNASESRRWFGIDSNHTFYFNNIFWTEKL
jgi:hypothetical protein